jgi:hypothetical protein
MQFFLYLLLCIFSISAHAQNKRIAVLEFTGIGVEPPILEKLSDQSRIVAANVLPQDTYLVMTRENMMQVLVDMGKDISCTSGSCEVEVGRNIGADFIISGNILRVEGLYLLTLKLHDTGSGNLLSGREITNASLVNLMGDIQDGSSILLQQGLDITLPPNVYSIQKQENTTPRETSPPKEPLHISKQRNTCPVNPPITSIEVKASYVLINDKLWHLTTPELQQDFEDMLTKCQQNGALSMFLLWRKRRKNTILWTASIVGTYWIAPVVGATALSARQDFEQALLHWE